MTPHLGSGAGQAMEVRLRTPDNKGEFYVKSIQDAYVLASVITLGVQEGIEVAQMTETYSMVRQPMGNFALNSSRRSGFRFELNSPGFEDVKENEHVPMTRLMKLAGEIIRGWKWTWTTAIQEDQKRARALL